MYRYYQTSDYDEWRIAKDDSPENPWKLANEKNASRVSILSVTADPNVPQQQGQRVGYAGPLYFDIDFEGGLAVAIASANKLCGKLQKLGVHPDDLEIHLSGKKGVHIFVPSAVFCKSIPLPHPDLPDLYSDVALHFWVEGIDFQVYSKNKGRMMRPPNSKRDEGIFKVRVTVAELSSLTPEKYAELTKEPRAAIFPQGPLQEASGLSKVFAGVCKAFNTRVQKLEKYRTVPPTAFDNLDGALPDCIKKLISGGISEDVSTGTVTLNSIAIQVGCWAKRAKPSDSLMESVNEKLITVVPSTNNRTDSARMSSVLATQAYVKSQDRYEFSCNAFRRLLSTKPDCDGCPVKQVMNDRAADPHIMFAAYFLYEQNGCYWADRDCTVMVSSFTLQRDVTVIDEETKLLHGSVMLLTNPLKGETITLSNFSEDAWLSKQALKKELTGVDGVAFFGTDNDVLRLRLTIARDEMLNSEEVNQVYKAEKAGILYRRRSGPENPRAPGHKGRLTYVEPGFSINDIGVMHTHQLVGIVNGVPRLGAHDLSERLHDQNNEAFSLLLRSNSTEVLAQFIPWFIACHIKPHIYTLEQRFPILAISGVAGTGKNATTKVAMRLCALKGEDAKFTLEAPQCTKFPFQDGLSNTTTIPRIINELNLKSVDKHQYKIVVEMLKAAYDSQTINKGVIGGGTKSGYNVSTLSWRISAPVVVLSEEPILTPAVQHRAISLSITPRGLQKGLTAFSQLEPRADDLFDIGRVLVKAALSTSVQAMAAILDKTELPPSVRYSFMQERNKFNYRVLLTAYQWAIPALEAAGLSVENVEGLRSLQRELENYLIQNVNELSKSAGTTEVDLVLKDFMLMAGDKESNYRITPQEHYAIDGDTWYLDVVKAYPKLKAFKSHTRDFLNIASDDAFLNLVPSMTYFKGFLPTDKLDTSGRPVVHISLRELEDKGLPVMLLFS